MSPVALAILLALVVAVIGILLVSAQRSSALKGYVELAEEVEQIRKVVRGQLRRDGNDLVVAGEMDGYPIQVRFSQDENTPGLNIRMKAPANFTYSIVPKGSDATEGRLILRTGDDMFDARFTSRTDHPAQAKIFLSSKRVLQQLTKLGCSSRTFLTISNGRVELSELVIPEPYTAKHVIDHLGAMKLLGDSLGRMPGAHIVEYREKKQRRVLQKVVIATGVLVALATLGMELRSGTSKSEEEVALAPSPEAETNVSPVDAAKVPRSDDWKLAAGDDLPLDVVGWMRANGIEFKGRMLANLSGTPTDVVYQLQRKQQGEGPAPTSKRVVVLVRNEVVFDGISEHQIVVVPVPQRVLANLEWQLKPEGQMDGDGLLILRSTDNSFPNQVLQLQNGKPVWGIIKDYQALNFR